MTYNSQVHPSDSEDRFFSFYKKLNDSVESFEPDKGYRGRFSLKKQNETKTILERLKSELSKMRRWVL